MTNKQLRDAVRAAAEEKGITGVMGMTDISPLSYERTRKVWDGVRETKISDYIDVLGVLDYKLKFISKGHS